MDESVFTPNDLIELKSSISMLGKENAYIAQLFSNFYSYKEIINHMAREERKAYFIEKEFVRTGLAYMNCIERTDPKGYTNSSMNEKNTLQYKLEELKEEIYETVCHSSRLNKLALEFTDAFPLNKLIKIVFKKV